MVNIVEEFLSPAESLVVTSILTNLQQINKIKVGSYLEFKECNGIYVFLNNSWKTLPESKEDDLANQTLTLIENVN